jgi:hypothetical protein
MFIHQAGKLRPRRSASASWSSWSRSPPCVLLSAAGRRQGIVTTKATRRLKAIEEYSELGAGFRIAMRDLEIRGAGNILGTEQSGNIAAVGYELYCQLLENSVRTLKKQPLRYQRHCKIELPVSPILFLTNTLPNRSLRSKYIAVCRRQIHSNSFASSKKNCATASARYRPQRGACCNCGSLISGAGMEDREYPSGNRLRCIPLS